MSPCAMSRNHRYKAVLQKCNLYKYLNIILQQKHYSVHSIIWSWTPGFINGVSCVWRDRAHGYILLSFPGQVSRSVTIRDNMVKTGTSMSFLNCPDQTGTWDHHEHSNASTSASPTILEIRWCPEMATIIKVLTKLRLTTTHESIFKSDLWNNLPCYQKHFSM